MAHKSGAAAVIVNSNGHVLLVKHSYGRLNWELPGGGSEANESVVETAIREVREETGLQVVAQTMTGVYDDPVDDMIHFVFRCQLRGAAATPRPDRDEITDCAYWPPEALPRPISDFTIQRIQDALASPGLPLPVTITPRRWLE